MLFCLLYKERIFMKKWLFFIIILAIFEHRLIATPYGGSISGAGQDQRALVSGYKYSNILRQGPVNGWPGRRRYQGRTLNVGFGRDRYYRRYRYIEEDPNPSTVHSRK